MPAWPTRTGVETRTSRVIRGGASRLRPKCQHCKDGVAAEVPQDFPAGAALDAVPILGNVGVMVPIFKRLSDLGQNGWNAAITAERLDEVEVGGPVAFKARLGRSDPSVIGLAKPE